MKRWGKGVEGWGKEKEKPGEPEGPGEPGELDPPGKPYPPGNLDALGIGFFSFYR